MADASGAGRCIPELLNTRDISDTRTSYDSSGAVWAPTDGRSNMPELFVARS